jgi:hypothetical protein
MRGGELSQCPHCGRRVRRIRGAGGRVLTVDWEAVLAVPPAVIGQGPPATVVTPEGLVFRGLVVLGPAYRVRTLSNSILGFTLHHCGEERW